VSGAKEGATKKSSKVTCLHAAGSLGAAATAGTAVAMEKGAEMYTIEGQQGG
jgi:hypothetical protein